MRIPLTLLFAGSAVMLLGACGDNAKLPEQASTGLNPTIPAPTRTFIPTVNIATARGWPQDGKPKATGNLSVNAFAKDLEHPRWLYVLPNGDVLVAESNGPERLEDAKGIKGWISQNCMRPSDRTATWLKMVSMLKRCGPISWKSI